MATKAIHEPLLGKESWSIYFFTAHLLWQEGPESWLGYSTLLQPLTECQAQAGFEGLRVFSQLLKVFPLSAEQRLCM